MNDHIVIILFVTMICPLIYTLIRSIQLDFRAKRHERNVDALTERLIKLMKEKR